MSHSITLVLEGVDGATYVWLNGHRLGYSQDSRLPAEFDVTEHLALDGPQLLALQVIKWSDASYLEDQDMWWLGGVHRPVYLRCKARTQVTDFFLRTPLELRGGAVDAARCGGVCVCVCVCCVCITPRGGWVVGVLQLSS